jgi:hypothetical protein
VQAVVDETIDLDKGDHVEHVCVESIIAADGQMIHPRTLTFDDARKLARLIKESTPKIIDNTTT